MLELITCPQCGARAEVTQRRWLDAIDGSIQHLPTICVSNTGAPPGPGRSSSSGLPPEHNLATRPSCSAPAPPAVRTSTTSERR